MKFQIDLDQVARRESEQTEWKESVADIDDVVATLCAFANDLQNLGGGYVVCGATEGEDEHGFPALVRSGLTAGRLKEIENATLACCRDRVSPPLAPLLQEVDADDGARRILVRNQSLAWFLARLQLAQAEGQGIQTIRKTMRAAGCESPIFKATEISVACVLPAHPRAGSWSGIADRGLPYGCLTSSQAPSCTLRDRRARRRHASGAIRGAG
jgi:predicted HTH transcriptional regulator